MREISLIAIMIGSLMLSAQPAFAGPQPKIDWRQLEQSIGETGDHVVGDKYCLRPTPLLSAA